MSKIVTDTFEYKSAGETVDATYLVHGTAKAWGQVTISGGTSTQNDSVNCSSITDDGAGQYKFSFSNNIVNSSFGYNCMNGTSSNHARLQISPNVAFFSVGTLNDTHTLSDDAEVSGQVWGNLA